MVMVCTIIIDLCSLKPMMLAILVIGIDLGYTYSRVAIAKGDNIAIIHDTNDDELRSIIPSHVLYSKAGFLVGWPAKEQVMVDPKYGVHDVKYVPTSAFQSR
jgi:molecular chaperone DnaK (HSP70)